MFPTAPIISLTTICKILLFGNILLVAFLFSKNSFCSHYYIKREWNSVNRRLFPLYCRQHPPFFWLFFFRPDTYLYHNIYSQCEHLLHTGLDNIFAVVLGHKWASRPLLHWRFPDPDIARAEVSTGELWFSCLNFFFFKPLWIHHTTAAPFIKRISCKWRLRGIFSISLPSWEKRGSDYCCRDSLKKIRI